MMQTWVSRVCTSMPMESTAALLLACGTDRVMDGAGSADHVPVEASRFIPSMASTFVV
jgi:hypothetical protein